MENWPDGHPFSIFYRAVSRRVRQGELRQRHKRRCPGVRPRRTASNDWHNLSRRGAQCAPTQRKIERVAGAQCAPLRYTMCRWFTRCAEVVPQGTFSCGVAAIHLVAPYGIPLYKKWRMADRYINSPFSIFNSQLFITSRTNQTDWRIHSCRSRHSAANYRSGCSGSAGSGHSGHRPQGRANRSA